MAPPGIGSLPTDAVPGMPVGSPGMEGPGAKPYDVLTFDRAGAHTVWATVDPR